MELHGRQRLVFRFLFPVLEVEDADSDGVKNTEVNVAAFEDKGVRFKFQNGIEF